MRTGSLTARRANRLADLTVTEQERWADKLHEDPNLTWEQLSRLLWSLPAAKVLGYCDPPLPLQPTNAAPGSLAKKQVLMERAAKGLALHHPDDNRIVCHEIDPDMDPESREGYCDDADGLECDE